MLSFLYKSVGFENFSNKTPRWFVLVTLVEPAFYQFCSSQWQALLATEAELRTSVKLQMWFSRPPSTGRICIQHKHDRLRLCSICKLLSHNLYSYCIPLPALTQRVKLLSTQKNICKTPLINYDVCGCPYLTPKCLKM